MVQNSFHFGCVEVFLAPDKIFITFRADGNPRKEVLG